MYVCVNFFYDKLLVTNYANMNLLIQLLQFQGVSGDESSLSQYILDFVS